MTFSREIQQTATEIDRAVYFHLNGRLRIERRISGREKAGIVGEPDSSVVHRCVSASWQV